MMQATTWQKLVETHFNTDPFNISCQGMLISQIWELNNALSVQSRFGKTHPRSRQGGLMTCVLSLATPEFK